MFFRSEDRQISVSTMIALTGPHTGLDTPKTIRRGFDFLREKLFQNRILYFKSIYSKTHVVVLVLSFTLSWLPWVLAFFSDLLYHIHDTEDLQPFLASLDTPEFNHWINRCEIAIDLQVSMYKISSSTYTDCISSVCIYQYVSHLSIYHLHNIFMYM